MTSAESPDDLKRAVEAHVNAQWLQLVHHLPVGEFERAPQDAGVLIDLTGDARLKVTTPAGTYLVLDDGVCRSRSVDDGFELVGFANGVQVMSVVVPNENPGTNTDRKGD